MLGSWVELYVVIEVVFEGFGRIALGLNYYDDEQQPLFYFIRLVSFLVIIYAIWDKNWARKN